jgi:hypothetical protein
MSGSILPLACKMVKKEPEALRGGRRGSKTIFHKDFVLKGGENNNDQQSNYPR